MARIVQIVADGRPGGGTTAVLTLSGLLAARGDEIVLVTQQDSYLVSQTRQAGLRVVGLDFSSRKQSIRLAVQLWRLLNEIDPAIVHVHGGRAALPMALIPHPCPVIYTVHGFHFLHKRPGVYQLAYLAEALCIARANCTVLVSDADYAVAKRLHLLRLSRAQSVIKNAVSVNGQMAIDKQYDIGFVGRLHFQKNPLILVDILKAMRPARPSLCVIGGGDLAEELETRLVQEGLREQVHLTGECDRTRALHLLSACRLMVLPSRWEGHPIALIEAMLLGIPAVASDISGNNEIVVDGQTGYLVPPTDVNGYADRLLELLEDDSLRARMEVDARAIAARDYSLDRMVTAYRAIYDGVAMGVFQELPA